jgi:hypothetical protein
VSTWIEKITGVAAGPVNGPLGPKINRTAMCGFITRTETDETEELPTASKARAWSAAAPLGRREVSTLKT